MARIRKQRDIIDRKTLTARLDELAAWSGYSDRTRGEVLDMFRSALQCGTAEVRRRFETERLPGRDAIRAQSFLMDQLIRTLHDFTGKYVYPIANPIRGEQTSILATGGYGRGQLAPFSDIDLMFLLPYKSTPHTEQVVEFMLYMLWDMGLKVGHATRSIDDAVRLAQGDLTIQTSLLEARWLWGDENLFRQFKARFQKEVVAGHGPAYAETKLAERDMRHEKMGDTRYVLEPNVKEGKGGLRDLQTLFWMAKFLYQVDSVEDMVERGHLSAADARRFAKAENFLWTVRCHLHYLAGRPEERLTFNVQREIAERMGYSDRKTLSGVERFMKHYFLVAKDVGDLTRVLCAIMEDDHKKRRRGLRLGGLFRKQSAGEFPIDGERLTVASAQDFERDPRKLLGLFREAQKHGLDIHPRALRAVNDSLKLVNTRLRADPDANRLFMEMLTDEHDPEETLKRLNEAGVFGRFITDFGRVVAQMQYDMYHVYTVDEHTIRAIGILNRIERGQLTEDHPVASEVIHEVESRDVLYVAVLLHDIAKGRGGDHSEIGAEVALKLGPRLGLNEWETETVSWLVRYHLAMSRTAFKRDIDDPKTVADFVALVQSPERLRLLLVLTVADIRAVGPSVWNEWKGGLLRSLYFRALEVMTGGAAGGHRAERVANAKKALRARLVGWSEDEIEAHLARGYDDYWLGFDVATHVHHAYLVRAAEQEGAPLRIEARQDPEHNCTEAIIYTADHPGLFARIAGAMSLGGASVLDARIVTLANGMALDTFAIQDLNGNAFADEKRVGRLWRRIEDALSGKVHAARAIEDARAKAMPSRTQVFKVPPRVLIDNKASATHTVVEVNGRDRVGFLHDVTAALTSMGLQISTAHISTYGERAVDVFYVKDVFGLKIEHDEKLKQMRARLLAAIEPPEEREKTAAE
ncbi:MAG: [protein-PII] uridylyltransferase [Hyphomicrobiales bacterium]|nr:[protein-PII] uridylyltransferase [Hyphomicrobiales bacterium]MCP5372097.1 [protein-PII] uridylyltransferase [Hyphomicrobiales bacterium]